MSNQSDSITFHGQPLTLSGKMPKVGEQAPGFEVLGNDLKPVTLGDYKGKVVVICSVPSLDTDVCDMEAKRFNAEAGKMGDDVQVVTISMDLPFAQKRWKEENSADNLVILSDHRDASFGQAYGVLLKELRLLARTIFVIDKQGVISYRQIVPELTDEPGYDEVLEKIGAVSA